MPASIEANNHATNVHLVEATIVPPRLRAAGPGVRP
jgi:hypothetical protein